MDAKELTKYCYGLQDRVIELEKQVKYLTQEIEKQRILVNDINIDVKMMQNGRK